MQFNLPQWQQNRAAVCASDIATGPGFDGCFIDMVGNGDLTTPGYLTAPPVNPATHQVWNVTDWNTAVRSLMHTIQAGNPGKILLGNGIGNGTRWFKQSRGESGLVNSSSMVMAEDWGTSPGKPLSQFRTVAAWQADVNAIQAIDAAGGRVLATVKPWGPGTAAQLAQWHSFSLASFMLGTGGRSYYGFVANKANGAQVDYPMDHINLGSPLGAYGYSQGAYVRYFSAGIAIVNPGTSSVTYTLPAGNYVSEVGTHVTGSITLPPHTGHLLSLQA
jgi:hypothetical protein